MAFKNFLNKYTSPSTPGTHIPDPGSPAAPMPTAETNPSEFQLTLMDTVTSLSYTGTFTPGETVQSALRRAAKEGVVSIPVSTLWLYSKNGKKLSSKLDPQSEPEVYPGATLIIDLQLREDPRFADALVCRKLRKAYPLVFFRKERGACIEKIVFTCYGYERPFDILRRMRIEGRLDDRHMYDMLHWPSKKLPGKDFSSIQYLCEFDPEPGRVFIIDDQGMAMQTLYGCPPADCMEQMHMLSTRKVDVISYE